MTGWSARGVGLVLSLAAAAWLSGCASRSTSLAPVEDRSRGSALPVPVAVDLGPASAQQLPGHENAGKPGYYTVKPGDTLIRIGLDWGQNWRDIARWSGLENPNVIEVGQVLRVAPPTVSMAVAQQPAPVPMVAGSGTVVRPIAAPNVTSTAVAPVQAGSAPLAPVTAPVVVAAAPPMAPPSASTAVEDDIAWAWPARGTIVAGFDEVKNKGIDIGGMAGDPVLAAADGSVVYVGAGLRGYGNLIILKHNNTYITAYAHNQVLLVKETQTVRKGQKIAEMGNSDADRVKLHFEVRRQGKPVDPAKYLPPR